MSPVSLAGGMSRRGGYVKGMGIFGEGGEERGGGVGIPGPIQTRGLGYSPPVPTPSGGCQNMYGWQAGGVHPTRMLSSCYCPK